MRSLLAGGLRPGFWVFLLLTQPALAQQPFPYQAVVDVPQLEVRSGPGGRYYPTSHLKKGDLVTVHRHDPGGWYMIAPPGGSFSWVQAGDIQQDSPTHGVVIRSDVMVRVGSLLDDHREVEQRRLNTGEEVTIIRAETWKTDTGEVKVLQIAPPKGEYRWVQGSSLIPVSELPQHQLASAPPAPLPAAEPVQPVKAFSSVDQVTPDSMPPVAFESVSATEEPPVLPAQPTPKPTPEAPAQFLPPVTATPSLVAEGAETAWRRNVPPEEFRQEIRQHLAELDQAFGEMIQQDIAVWNFQELEAGYVELEKQAQSKAISSIVDFRMQAIERYRKRIHDYQEFTRVANETTQRDLELAMQQQQTLPGSEPQPAEDTSGLVNAEDETATPRPIQPVSSTKPIPQPESETPATGTPAGRKQFDGAGVVGKLATPKPNGAEYVLMTPDGRVLAYLQAEPGLDLSAYSGQSMGVVGQRAYDESLQADLIFVHELEPVKLRR